MDLKADIKTDIKEKLEEELGLTVYVDNDVRAMALGESWFGATKDIANFVTLNKNIKNILWLLHSL